MRTCNSFGLPLLVLVDTPGFLPGIPPGADGVIRHGAKLVHAFAEATVPSVTVIVRKAFGGAFIAMNSKALGADYVFAWPGVRGGRDGRRAGRRDPESPRDRRGGGPARRTGAGWRAPIQPSTCTSRGRAPTGSSTR